MQILWFWLETVEAKALVISFSRTEASGLHDPFIN